MIAVTIHDLVTRVAEANFGSDALVRRTAVEAAHGEQVVARAIVSGQLHVVAFEDVEYLVASAPDR